MNTPEKPLAKQFSRRSLLKAAAGVALGGLSVSACGPDGSAPPTTVKDPVPTTIVPETTTTAPSTTEAPTTTHPERTFASPEQQAQVEAVEANMVRFFELTPEDIGAYMADMKIVPQSDGFSTTKGYPNSSNFNMNVVNLGTFSLEVGNGLGIMQVYGCITQSGDRFTGMQIVNITDPDFVARFPGNNTVFANVLKADESNTYVLDEAASVESDIRGAKSFVEAINSRIGEPMNIEPIIDPTTMIFSGYTLTPNPEMTTTLSAIHESSINSQLRQVLDGFSPEELKRFGVYINPDEITQATLNGFDSVQELLSSLPYGSFSNFFGDAKSVI